jgi:hypothetical protein
MRTVDQVPGLVPNYDVTFTSCSTISAGRSAYRETDEEQADLENVINNMLHGEYNDPKRVVAFNTAEKWCQMFPRMSRGKFSSAPLHRVFLCPHRRGRLVSFMLDYGRLP